MDQVRILIIGGGVVGCAIAAELSAHWPDVFLVEQLPRVGMATSTRNSGVIHSGIYYSPGSLKARHCLEGNRLTFAFCEKHRVAHRATGKLVVATDSREQAELEKLHARGQENGVAGLRLIGPAEIREREPRIAGVAALHVPSTGIVSAEELVRAYARVATDRGAHIVTRARVVSLDAAEDGLRAEVKIGDEIGAPADAAQHSNVTTELIQARCVINAAGLFADEVAALVGNHSWQIYPVRGEYCEVRGPQSALINGLVYPLPHADGLSLGMHFTKTIWDTLLIGPTARYVEQKDDYERNRLSVTDFVAGAQKLLPKIKEADLQLAYSGLRPKLAPPGSGHAMVDFVVERDVHAPQMIHLVGIDSPGLTAAPSIARHVSAMVSEALD
jgi:glycerol-3-phosphate dehydrogenase